MNIREQLIYNAAYNAGVEQTLDKVFTYLKKHYLLRNTEIPMHWVSPDKVKEEFTKLLNEGKLGY